MSRDNRKVYYDRERDPRVRAWERNDYRSRPTLPRKRSRSRSPIRGTRGEHRGDIDKRLSRSPRKPDKDLIDDNILSEISKLPEPSELWDSQFQEGGFQQPPPPTFAQEGTANSNYGSNYQSSYSGMYDEFPPLSSIPTAPRPPDIISWNQPVVPPAPAPPSFINAEDQIKKEAAIETEMRHQKAALSKQREDYIKKASSLKKELDTLKDQRTELRGDSKRSPSPDTRRFLKENTKLQLEIQNKLKTINNVVDMLNGIIGEEAQQLADLEESASAAGPGPTNRPSRKSRSPAGNKSNYVYYDPEMHWCRVCNEFPPTAKDYLNHLHSQTHQKMATQHMEAPWHSVTGLNEGFPSFPSAPTKRTPIRGLQFFVPSTAWYCKLCDQFIGDLHCASAHLKSVVHSKNYTNFVEQNPHWETDWMSDRQKAFEKSRAGGGGKGKGTAEEKPQYTAHTITFNKDGFHTKRTKDSPPPQHDDNKKKKEKKKKNKRKKNSSSSSESDSSSSDSAPSKKKKSKKKDKKLMEDKSLKEWMSDIHVDRLNDKDRKLLDHIKARIKKEKEDDKRRSPDRGPRPRRERSPDPSRSREEERREGRERDKRSDGRQEGRGSPPRAERDRDKKPEYKKMPFIGKMPVYKNLSRNVKVDDQKKEEQKKKDEEEAIKKKREELDVEIQKKVAEFKQKIAKAQLERQVELAAPGLALPTMLGGAGGPAGVPTFLPPPGLALSAPMTHASVTPATPAPQVPTQNPPSSLSQDFQEALDIIFPEVKKAERAQQEFLASMAPGMGGFSLPSVMPSYPPPSPLLPGLLQHPPPQMMMGFDLNAPLFPSRAQLYDAHVPLVTGSKPRQQNKNNARAQQNRKQEGGAEGEGGAAADKKKEQLDDLALLGIDASDVGAGI